jgi:SAM-dependent methyltransferase
MSCAARDGSPVELYARMPTFGEPELVHAAIPAGAEILELGSGAGRMTHRLLELGHPVTAVDNSAEMLAHVRGAETVHAEIEELDLGRTFPCVLLASQLVNVDDDRQRAGFLATCARHLAPDGVVLIQRYDPDWAVDPGPSDHERDGVHVRVLEPRREAERLIATVEYEVDGQSWRHGPFTSRILTDAELGARLWQAGLLSVDEWLDDRRTWLVARALPDESALYLDVPAAEPLVAGHRLRWDAAGPLVPAHVTVLYPFLDPADISEEVDAELARIASEAASFDVRFERVGRFSDVVWLAPEPVGPIAALTDAVAARWPDHPPYGGAFEEVIHHLTVADGAPPNVLDRLASELVGGLPIAERVETLTLGVREAGTWSVRRRYALGGDAS